VGRILGSAPVDKAAAALVGGEVDGGGRVLLGRGGDGGEGGEEAVGGSVEERGWRGGGARPPWLLQGEAGGGEQGDQAPRDALPSDRVQLILRLKRQLVDVAGGSRPHLL
jgi:hypothetical protein